MTGNEQFDLAQKPRIVAACLLQKVSALAAIPFQGSVIELLDSTPALRVHGVRFAFNSVYSHAAGEAPFTFDGAWRDTEDLGDFFYSQTAEEPQFDDLPLSRIKLAQSGQGVVDGDHVGTSYRRCDHRFVQGNPLDVSTSLAKAITPGVIESTSAASIGPIPRKNVPGPASGRCASRSIASYTSLISAVACNVCPTRSPRM